METDTKCIVRDTVHLVGVHTPGEEVFYLRQMQSSHTRPKEEWGADVSGDLNHVCGAVLPGPCLSLANHLASFTPDWTQGPPQRVCTLLAKTDSRAKGYGAADGTYDGLAPPPFLTPGSLSARVSLGRSP